MRISDWSSDVCSSDLSPQTAANVANTLADVYIADQVNKKSDATGRATNFLEGQIDQLRAQVQTAEAAVAEYRAQNGLFEASADSSVTQEELAGLNTQLAGARAQQAEAEARLSTARAQLAQGGTGEELGEALDSTVISQLRAQRARVSAEAAALSQRYGPGHTDLQRAQEQLRDLDKELNGEVRRSVANARQQPNAARDRNTSLARSRGSTDATLAAQNIDH